jgi:hypothetical protein
MLIEDHRRQRRSRLVRGGRPSPSGAFPLPLNHRRGERGTQERFQACLVCAGYIDCEIGGQNFGTIVQLLDRLLDRGSRRYRSMLAGFNVGGQLCTGPTKRHQHAE